MGKKKNSQRPGKERLQFGGKSAESMSYLASEVRARKPGTVAGWSGDETSILMPDRIIGSVVAEEVSAVEESGGIITGRRMIIRPNRIIGRIVETKQD